WCFCKTSSILISSPRRGWPNAHVFLTTPRGKGREPFGDCGKEAGTDADADSGAAPSVRAPAAVPPTGTSFFGAGGGAVEEPKVRSFGSSAPGGGGGREYGRFE